MKRLLFGIPLIVIIVFKVSAKDKIIDKCSTPKMSSVATYKLPTPPSFYSSTTDVNTLTPAQVDELAKYQIAYFTFLKTLSNESDHQKNADEQIAYWQKKMNR